MSAEHSSMARSLCVFSVTVVLGLGGGGRAEAQQPPSPREPPELEWQRTFGGSDGDQGYSVQQTSDGGYVLCGNTSSSGAGSSDVYLVKLRGDRPPSGHFLRGDATADGAVNITDAVFTLNLLFLGGSAPAYADAADADDNGAINVTDAVYTLNFLFLGGTEIPEPAGAECGMDPSADDLGCDDFARCP